MTSPIAEEPMNIQICLVSDQLLANYIPVMMHKPDQVHLVSSAHTLKKGLTERLERMLQNQGVTVVLHEDMPSSDIQLIREFACWLGQVIDQATPNANISLNITGGNKLMALGMWEVFSGAMEVIYTDTYHQCIEYLHNNEKEPLESILDVNSYLEAYGVQYIDALSDDKGWQQVVKTRKRTSYYLANNAESLRRFMVTITDHAHNAIEEIDDELILTSPTQTMTKRPSFLGCRAMEVFEKEGLIVWDGYSEFTFADAESARYLGGLWLEEYVYLCALEAEVEHIASSVKVIWGKSRPKINELDLIIVHRNRMLVIDCNTLRLDANEQKDSDIAYKVSDMGDGLRGLFGRTCFVSTSKPNHVLLERARSKQLTIIAIGDLNQLKRYIQKWMHP